MGIDQNKGVPTAEIEVNGSEWKIQDGDTELQNK
jgi:hypothetical protein